MTAAIKNMAVYLVTPRRKRGMAFKQRETHKEQRYSVLNVYWSPVG